MRPVRFEIELGRAKPAHGGADGFFHVRITPNSRGCNSSSSFCGITLDTVGNIQHFYTDKVIARSEHQVSFTIRDIGEFDTCEGACVVVRCRSGTRCINTVSDTEAYTYHGVSYPARTRHRTEARGFISVYADTAYRNRIIRALQHYQDLMGGVRPSDDPF